MLFLSVLPLNPHLSKNRKNNIAFTKFGARIFSSKEYSQARKEFKSELEKVLSGHSFEEFDKLTVYAMVLTDKANIDGHNFVDAIMDIIQEVTGINDRFFEIGHWSCKKIKKQKTSSKLLKKSIVLGIRLEKVQTVELRTKGKGTKISSKKIQRKIGEVNQGEAMALVKTMIEEK